MPRTTTRGGGDGAAASAAKRRRGRRARNFTPLSSLVCPVVEEKES
jgi:hypothetical protein